VSPPLRPPRARRHHHLAMSLELCSACGASSPRAASSFYQSSYYWPILAELDELMRTTRYCSALPVGCFTHSRRRRDRARQPAQAFVSSKLGLSVARAGRWSSRSDLRYRSRLVTRRKLGTSRTHSAALSRCARAQIDTDAFRSPRPRLVDLVDLVDRLRPVPYLLSLRC
jgi:hypothetical protein